MPTPGITFNVALPYLRSTIHIVPDGDLKLGSSSAVDSSSAHLQLPFCVVTVGLLLHHDQFPESFDLVWFVFQNLIELAARQKCLHLFYCFVDLILLSVKLDQLLGNRQSLPSIWAMRFSKVAIC